MTHQDSACDQLVIPALRGALGERVRIDQWMIAAEDESDESKGAKCGALETSGDCCHSRIREGRDTQRHLAGTEGEGESQNES